MQYYIFDEISPNRDAPYLDLPVEIDLIESIMGKKPKFDELPIKIEAELDDDVIYTDIINPGVPLFSDKMKTALDGLGIETIEYFPVVLVDVDTDEVVAEYWLAIVKEIIACIDLEKSEFKQNASGASVIARFAIDEAKTSGSKLFRFHNIPGLMIINEGLKEELSKIDFTGVNFKPTQEYNRKV